MNFFNFNFTAVVQYVTVIMAKKLTYFRDTKQEKVLNIYPIQCKFYLNSICINCLIYLTVA